MEERCVVHLAIIDRLHLRFVEPFDALSVLPQPILHLVVFWDDIGAEAMLLTLEPVALVAACISPGVDSKAVFLVVFVLT